MPTSVNDNLVDQAIDHAISLNRFSNGAVRRVVSLLNQTDKELRAAIIEALLRLPADSFTVQRLEELLGSVRQLNLSAMMQVEAALQGEMRDLADFEAAFQVAALQDAFPEDARALIRFQRITPEQAYAAAMARPFQGGLLRDWTKSLEASRAAKVRETIRQGYVQGQTTDQIVRKIIGTKAKSYRDGVIDRSRREVESVVRTALSHTAEMAREKALEANGDLITAVRWVSTLDSRTSELCRIRDGKQYTPEDHKPIGHKVPWLQGPGRLHFNALASGTTILCSDGTKPIDAVKAGDLVLTHKGRFMPVIEARSKLSEDGIVRIVHTKSGRVIRATDDHPVLTTDGWKFVGALKIGDSLFQDAQQAAPVASFEGVVGATPEYGPALADQTDVSLQRALKLVSTNVDLYGDKEIGPCEIENGAAGLVLANPAIIKDQCLRHHLFALADALRELGRYRLGDLLADIERNAGPEHSLSCLGVEAVDLPGLLSSPHDFRAACGVVQGHSTRMSRVNIAGFLGHAPCPMVSSSFAGLPSGSVPDLDLLCPGSDSNAMISGVSGEASVCEAFLSLNVSQGHELSEVVFGNQVGVEAVSFLHDQIVAFEVQSYKGELFDLEVAEDCSYVAGGLVVSNCRSTQVPVTKSWRELGIDMDELEPSTRASMDGQVSAELTYSKWLQRQSRARQEEILGVTRAALVRDGKLPVDELYSDRGAYLTIEQLRAKYAETFKRAGL